MTIFVIIITVAIHRHHSFLENNLQLIISYHITIYRSENMTIETIYRKKKNQICKYCQKKKNYYRHRWRHCGCTSTVNCGQLHTAQVFRHWQKCVSKNNNNNKNHHHRGKKYGESTSKNINRTRRYWICSLFSSLTRSLRQCEWRELTWLTNIYIYLLNVYLYQLTKQIRLRTRARHTICSHLMRRAQVMFKHYFPYRLLHIV